MPFSSLGLQADLLRAIAAQGYESPTPIQQQAIPAILSGHDLMAGAQTGTGKTAAFTLPMLQNLMDGRSHHPRKVRALVLTPTRELAGQVAESVRTYGKFLPLRSAVVFGGVNINPQIAAMHKGVDILIATPGRLIDHLDRGTVDLSAVNMLVLDEADRMLDMGFLPAMERILKRLPKQRQTLLFSATFSGSIKQLAHRFLHQAQHIEVARSNAASDSVQHSACLVDRDRKRELLALLIGSRNWRQVLVFTRTKRGADRLAKQLQMDGIDSAAIHGDKSQGARTRALAAFKSQRVRVLVATDVAARGIDIDQLPHVVNFELPDTPEDYVHRIGRTGRAGNQGEALSLVSAEERSQFAAIEQLLGAKIPSSVIEGFEPDPNKPHKISPNRPQQARNARPKSTGRRPAASGRGKPPAMAGKTGDKPGASRRRKAA